MYIKFNGSLFKMSTGLYDFTDGHIGDGHADGDHEDYTAQDTNICLEFEYNQYKRVKTDGRVNQSCKRKRARPR